MSHPVLYYSARDKGCQGRDTQDTRDTRDTQALLSLLFGLGGAMEDQTKGDPRRQGWEHRPHRAPENLCSLDDTVTVSTQPTAPDNARRNIILLGGREDKKEVKSQPTRSKKTFFK